MWSLFIDQWNGIGFFLSSVGHLRDPLPLYRRLWLHCPRGIFSNSLVSGKVVTPPTSGVSWHKHSLTRIICYHCCLPSLGVPVDIQAHQVPLCNSGVVEVINSRKSKVPRVMEWVRVLTICTLRHNFYFQAVHVPRKQNNIADSLSRFQMERFRQLAPQFSASPEPIPACLLTL